MGSFSHPGHWWRTDRRAAGSVLHEWGTHLIDWALSLVPGPITEIAGFFQKNVWHDVTIEDWASVVLRFEGGRTAMIELGHGVGAPRPKWRILGSRGSVWGDWGLEHLTVMAYQDGRLLTTRVPVDEAAGDSFYVDLADTLLTGSRPGATAADAARVVEVLEVAQRSGRAGKAQAVGL
jgi:scyllo-inositol 2-dehydrogenase (NADP+)